MKKWMFVHIMMLAGTQLFAQGTYQEKVNNYVQKYKDLAMAEQQRSGIPACITLGQGILETSAGCSDLMTQANNHFGIKCKKEWTGETFAHTDDAPNECFRKYKCDLDSYKDHSDYLKTSQRYASLFMLSPTDYKGWAFGLKRCGYATNPRYAQQLIKIIEDFHLQDYTLAAANNPIPTKEPSMVVAAAAQPVTVAVVPQQTLTDTVKPMPVITQANLADNTAKVNGLRAFYAHKGDVLLEYAIRYNMRYAKLLELNDLPDAPLEADMFVYLERKNSKGAHEQHYVQPGETLLQIAQAEGMQLKQLRALNQLADNDQPVTGTILNCQQPAGAKPAVKSMTVTNEPAYVSNTNTSGNSDYITRPAAANPEPARTAPQPAVTAMDNSKPAQEEEEKTPVVVAEKKEQPVAAPVTEKKETPPPVRVVRAAPQPAPRTMSREDEPFNIANEKAVEETVVRNNPRYVDRSADNAPVNNWPAATTPANTTAADQAPAPAPEPQDELSKLKAKLDRVVYGDSRPSGSAIKVTNDPTPVYTASTQTPAAPVQTVAAQPESNGTAQYYTVAKGDTAFGIAKKHNITVKQLMDWNHLDFDGIKTGQKLRVK